MEDIYQTNSLSFKNKKDGLINFRTVSYVLGILVLVEAGLFAICAGISAIYHESSYICFVWAILINIGIGGVMILAGNRKRGCREAISLARLKKHVSTSSNM